MTKDISSIPTVGWDGHPDGPLVFLQDHEAHVTRLQAEVERQTEMKEKNFWALMDELNKSRELRAELTKARELLTEVGDEDSDKFVMGTDWHDAADAFLSNQSAPVTKNPGDNKPLLPIGTVAICANGHKRIEHLWSEHDRTWIGRTVRVLSWTPTWVGTVAVVQDVYNNEITGIVNDLLTPCEDWTPFKSADGKDGRYKVENGMVHCELQIDIRNDQSAPADKAIAKVKQSVQNHFDITLDSPTVKAMIHTRDKKP